MARINSPVSVHLDHIQNSYGIIIDAGSSGSRIMIYTWRDAHAGLSMLPEILPAGEKESDWQFKKEPGISSFSQDVSKLAVYLDEPLQFALSKIPEPSRQSTPLFLYATAGMRLLSNSSQSIILQKACSHIKSNYPFLISNCARHFQVISGEMEGIYGWLTVNYLKGGLSSSAAADSVNTFGFLDMVRCFWNFNDSGRRFSPDCF